LHETCRGIFDRVIGTFESERRKAARIKENIEQMVNAIGMSTRRRPRVTELSSKSSCLRSLRSGVTASSSRDRAPALLSAQRESVLVEMVRAQPVALWSHFFCHNAASISARMLELYNEQYC
jgi:hypothetical protein